MKCSTAREYIDHLDQESGESWSDVTDELAEAMENYAKMYHERQLKELGIGNTNSSIKDWVETQKQMAWDKMGDTGKDEYLTDKMNWNEENYWYGYFRAMESINWKFLDRDQD